MIDDPNWQMLDNEAALKFIKEVRDEDFSPLFNGRAYELWARNLRFFDGYSHVSLLNKAMIPYFTLDYLSNGENHYYMDGSEHPLEMLVERGALRLTERNVLEYLEFFSDSVFDPDRKVKFITDPSKTVYAGAGAMAHHFLALKSNPQSSLTYDENSESFFITLPVLYDSETVHGRVQVEKAGRITILEPLRLPLMNRARHHEKLHYSHPHEKEVLEANAETLQQSKEGKRLWEMLQSHGCEIRVISGTGWAAFVPNARKAYVVAPQNTTAYSPYQVIALAGALRDLELQLIGEKRGNPLGDRDTYAEQNCALNLDIVLEICIIVDELADAGHEDIRAKFKSAGFDKLYSGYKNDMDMEEMVGILAKFQGIGVKE